MIHILMATHNGEKYIEEQLQSIIHQTEKNWMLHICDDCSEDKTREMIQRFVDLYPDRIFFSVNETNQGACKTFSKLIQEVREPGDYAFCDQDDIWKPEKLEIMQCELRKNEWEDGKAVLVYSDVEIINDQGKVTADSFVRESGLNLPQKKLLEHLLLYNCVQGCTMMWNYPLHCLVEEIPHQALMHDWWMALVAAGNGKIIFIDKVLASYRQHSDNVVGAFDWKKWQRDMRKKAGISNWNRLCQNNRMLQNERIFQAKAYRDCFGDDRVERFLQIMHDKMHLRRVFRGIYGGYIFLSKKYSIKFYLI